MSYKAIPGVVYTNPEIAGVREDRGGVAGRRYFVYREENTDGILWAFCRGE